ncbi:DUF421 domain-containing protein [Brevibacillus fulvus]|uniref:Uncharacterized membrane protein YcaP (DUF421 family) n=1 Tax=Brevibacillus fulvus TaxID=1125967 RepID=A0A939BS06_9BACL|nr:DUF421 domain-containing protein [Brevibacillus fulvus]MBM7589983.1 uncharacterized membrane protein YcaP (DUF421 family) [Brevibacillus fulvus]
MELATILLRTLLTYFFILMLLRLMGKRELGKLSVFDVVISIMLAEMAVMTIENVKEPMLNFFLPMMLIAVLEIIMAFISLRSKRFRDIVDGTPELIIENGEIREDVMRRNRMNMDDLLVHLRQKNIKNVADVEFALLEPTGQMSVFPKPDKDSVTRGDFHFPPPKRSSSVKFNGLPTPLIMDGQILEEGLQRIGQNKFWLKQKIRHRGIKKVQDISFCCIDDQGNIHIDIKDKPRP